MDRPYPTFMEVLEVEQTLREQYQCDRDHCTPEERAVINKAVQWAMSRFREISMTGADKELRDAVCALPLVRAKTEETEK